MIFTRRFWWLLAAGIPLGICLSFVGQASFVLAYDVVLFAIAFITSRMSPSLESLRIRRQFDPVLSVRAANRIVLILDNDGNQPLLGTIRDEPPPDFLASERQFSLDVPAGRTREIVYTLTPYQRGSDQFRATFIRLKCPLGLAERQVEMDTSEPLRVYPNVLALREFDFLQQRGRLRDLGIHRSRERGLGTEFESLREYSEGDDYRKIDWKASARRGHLVTRVYEQERNQSVIICIDIGRYMLAEVNGVRKLDHVLDALLMLTQAATIKGDLVGALVFSDKVCRYIPPRKGRAQVGAVIEAIHDLVAEPVDSDPGSAFAYLSARWKRRSLLVLFTDFDEQERASLIATTFGPMARKHVGLLVRVQDPRLDEVMMTPAMEVRDIYRKAAAGMLKEDLEIAQRIIQTAGINSLEAEPQDLASRLVSYYFTVKERAIL